ncbi:ABC transporter permease [Leucobacter sp. UCD-THU]|uniref:sugar ABC transporter permease n=1 Tax=Leucobacter sp. UCD-THU TaxID=1292023 RepID=UPI000364E894|nr:hypothetical protein [Leucobacter sp. UCD-THU]EYT56601.1 ABC transporter permease [Leucobacter sp. UCD-THU]
MTTNARAAKEPATDTTTFPLVPERQGFLQRQITNIRHGELGAMPVILALAAIWIFFSINQPLFLSSRNLTNLLLQAAVVGTLAMGLTIVLLLGEIDLSIAAVAGVCAALMAQLLTGDMPVWLVLGVTLVTGIAIGAFQGFFVSVARVPSFVVTLAGLLGFQGLMLILLGDNGAINVDNPFVRSLTTTFLSPVAGYGLAVIVLLVYIGTSLWNRKQRTAADLPVVPLQSLFVKVIVLAVLSLAVITLLNSYAGLPLIVVLVLALCGILTWVLQRTKYGRYVYAVGGNPEAARRAGINLIGMRMSAFMILGLVIALGGIFGASRYASVSFNAFAGGSLMLEAIGAAVIGGTSLFGGRGRIMNAILGALVIGSLSNGLDLQGAGSAQKLMFSGGILLLAVTLDAVSRRGRSRA